MKLEFKDISNTALFDTAVILFASIAVVLPIYVWGIPFGNDMPQHYQFALQFEKILSEGSIYPSWAAEPNFGFGDVGVRFYPPAAYYLLSFCKSLTGDWYIASVLAFLLIFFVGSIAVYAWSREYFDRTASVVAAIVFLVMPYHANQIYNAFLYAEFAGTALLPFCFLFVTRLTDRGGYVNVAGLAASYALLVLTHLPLAVIGSICLLAYSLFCLKKESLWRTLALLAAAVIAGLAASSVYWVRMISEFSLVKVTGAEFSQADFDFRSNFLLSGLISSGESYADRTLIFVDLMLALMLLISVTGFILYARKNRGGGRRFWPVAGLTAFAIFFTLPLSSPVWENVGVLARVQFPWRWLAVVSITASLLAASGVSKFVEIYRSPQRPVAIAIGGLAAIFAAFTAAQVIRPAIYMPAKEFNSRVSTLGSSESCECLWPVWAKKEALQNKVPVSAGERTIEIVDWSSTSRNFSVSAGPGTEARIATFYYPFWRASVGGKPVEPFAGPAGEILISLPESEAKVDLFFVEPIYFQFAWIITSLSWLALIGALLAAVYTRFTDIFPRFLRYDLSLKA